MCARDLLRLDRDARECTGSNRDCPTCPLGNPGTVGRDGAGRVGSGRGRGRDGSGPGLARGGPDEPGPGQSSVPPRNEIRTCVRGSHLIRGGIAVWARVHEAFIPKPFPWRTPHSADGPDKPKRRREETRRRFDSDRGDGRRFVTRVRWIRWSVGPSGLSIVAAPGRSGSVRYGACWRPLPNGRDDPAVIVTPVLAASRRRRVSAAGR